MMEMLEFKCPYDQDACIDKVFKLEEANEALEMMNENKHFGKLVLLTN